VFVQAQLVFCELFGRDVLDGPIDESYIFEVVGEEIVEITNPLTTSLDVVQFEFTKEYFCTISTGIYSALLDLPWRCKELLTPIEE
jgi:hypothetical protein